MTNENVDFAEEEVVDPALVLFRECTEKGMNEEAIKLAMIQGQVATFKNVTRLYNQFLIDEGLAMSKEDKDEVVNAIMEDADITTEDGLAVAIAAIVERGNNITEKSAAALIRAYAKANDIAVYKSSKASATGRVGFTGKYHEWLIEHPLATEEEAADFISNSEYSTGNVRNHMSYYQSIRKMVNAIASK